MLLAIYDDNLCALRSTINPKIHKNASIKTRLKLLTIESSSIVRPMGPFASQHSKSIGFSDRTLPINDKYSYSLSFLGIPVYRILVVDSSPVAQPLWQVVQGMRCLAKFVDQEVFSNQHNVHQ